MVTFHVRFSMVRMAPVCTCPRCSTSLPAPNTNSSRPRLHDLTAVQRHPSIKFYQLLICVHIWVLLNTPGLSILLFSLTP